MFVRFRNHLTFTVPSCWSDNLILIGFDIQSQFIALELFVSMFPMLSMIYNPLSWLWLHYYHDTYMPKYWFNKPSCCIASTFIRNIFALPDLILTIALREVHNCMMIAYIISAKAMLYYHPLFLSQHNTQNTNLLMESNSTAMPGNTCLLFAYKTNC